MRGLTHDFYKYPARFSPIFARAVIEAFTKPGQLVLDPHAGGATTLVEARALGRRAVGVDVSSLAQFVAKVKCTIYSDAELKNLSNWAARLPNSIDIHRPSSQFIEYARLGYYKHLDHPSRWRLRKAIDQGLASAIRLGTPRLETFGRCVVLRTAQWALDGRSKASSVEEFRAKIAEIARRMVQGAVELRRAVQTNGRYPVAVLHRDAAGLENDPRMADWRAPKLVITSPRTPESMCCITDGKLMDARKRRCRS